MVNTDTDTGLRLRKSFILRLSLLTVTIYESGYLHSECSMGKAVYSLQGMNVSARWTRDAAHY
jgi:hypothetical protein